ncbi:MAG: ABC-2 transporter permease [Anaerolineales bacterium]|nr:ABC-2 transporter permease [Anaerolineales bacterium]
MLRQIIAITIKDWQVLVRDRGGMVSLFLMPIMFILVMSAAQQGMYEVADKDNPLQILVVNNDAGQYAGEAVTALEGVEGIEAVTSYDGKITTREYAEELIVDNIFDVAVVFPADFSERVLAAATDEFVEPALVSFIADPATSYQFLAPIRGALEGFIREQAAYAQMPLRLESGFDSLAAQVPEQQAPFVQEVGSLFLQGIKSDDSAVSTGSLGIEFEQTAPAAYKATQFPTSAEQNVPGYTIFGVFFIIQVLAGSILQEKQKGTFRRLLVAPLSQVALLLGKLLPYYLINLVQVASMFAIGHFFFGMNLGNAPGGMILITLATAAAATGLGLLVATLGKTPEQIGGLSTMLALTLAAVGGMMVPVFTMPEIMQTISKISPHNWALSGYQDVIVRGLGLSDVLFESAVLGGFALIFFLFAVWRFRFEEN